MPPVRIALIHDWLTGMRGGERVLEVLAAEYPEADLFTLVHVPNSTSARVEELKICASPLNRIPGIGRHYRKFLPLFPWAASRIRPRGYDLVISISHAVAKNVIVEKGTPHLSYCLTPMRYIWDQAESYMGTGPRRWLAAPLISALRQHDIKHSDPQHVDRFVAISETVRDRIRRHYQRDSRIVHPPVDTQRYRPSNAPTGDFYLLVGGFVPYKREDLVLEAFRGMDRSLVVAGDGPGRRKLESRAPANVEFCGRVGDDRLLHLMQNCRALIYPQEEDFGIAAVEAQAAGRPVIALGRGGAVDSVRPLLRVQENRRIEICREGNATGIFFSEQSPDGLRAAIDAFESHEDEFDSRSIREHAETFSIPRFLAELKAEIEISLQK